MFGAEPEELCRVMMEMSGMAVVVLDREGHRLYVNDETVKMLGRPREELLRGVFGDGLPPGDRQRAVDGFRRCVQTGRPVFEFASRPLEGGGNMLTSASWGPLKDSQGNVVGVVAMSRDITQDEIREQMLRRTQELYRTLVEEMGGSVIRVNREGRRTFVSDHTAEFSGRPEEEVLSGRFGDTMVPEDRERAWALLMETFRTGAPVSGFVSRQLIRGEERHIMANWAAIKDGDGKIVEVQTTSFDVTEQVRLREQLELYAARMRRAQEEERLAVSRFLHDDTIQALLLVALAVGEVINEGRVEGHDKRRLQRCATTLQDQMEALRRFSMGLRPAILDRMGLDAAIEWFVRETCEAKGVEGVVHIREGWRRLKPSVEVRLFRIVQEAVNNAVRHGSPRKVEVSLVLLDGQLKLEVKDDGVGFEPNASHIDLLRRDKLGLVGMQERAKALGAEVRIESKTNAGCRVYLWGSVEKMEQLA